jgi:hypothetical protein
VERVPLKWALAHLERAATPLFVKPAGRVKAFTGFVAYDSSDFRLTGVSRNQDVWVSKPVVFVSEWRAYVIAGALFHLSHYEGDAAVSVDMVVIEKALERFGSARAPAAYAIDFGVLADGQTALVEANDGFSIGAYPGVDPGLYTQMLAARWKEMSAATDQA